jgi:ribonuclease HI
MDAHRLLVLMDSELVVLQMQGRYRVRAPGLVPLWQKATALVGRFQNVRFQAVPRAQNAAADRLASQAAILGVSLRPSNGDMVPPEFERPQPGQPAGAQAQK